MKYIENLREGDRISGIYLCKTRQSALTKAGKPYENLIFQDKTGTVDGKIWDPNSGGIDDFDSLDYVDIVADVTMFQGQPQLNVKRARKAREGEYDPKDYLPVSSKDIEGMYKELLGFINRVKSIQVQQCGKDRSSWICGRTAGAHFECNKTVRLLYS